MTTEVVNLPWPFVRLESITAHAPPPRRKATLMRFDLPLACNSLSPLTLGLPHPVRSAFRFFQPPSGLLLKLPWGLVSCLWRFWDSPSRVFPLVAAPPSRRGWLPPENLPISHPFAKNLPRRASSKQPDETAGCYWPDGQCDPTDKPSTGVNPLPGPFTSCASVTRCRRPVLSWGRGAF